MHPLAALRIALPACLSLAVVACATTGAAPRPAPVALGTAFTLSPGDVAGLPGGDRLRHVATTADSRCPPDVQCVWAGEATVAFEFLPAGGHARGFELVLPRAPSTTMAGWRIELVALSRGDRPDATVRVDRH